MDINIDIDYYDNSEKDLIKSNYPKDFIRIEKLIGQKVAISFEDFKTYSYFRHQCDATGYRTFFDFSKISKNWHEYELYFDFDTSTGKLINKYPGQNEQSNISECLGVAGGLSVAGAIYGLTPADWTKIPISQNKDFDFKHLAGFDNRFINIEAKGSIVDDNSLKSSPVSHHKANIKAKKTDEIFIKKYDTSADTCLGMITVADKSNFLKTWILDPIFEGIEISPQKLKLLKRLHYYYYIFRFISKRSYLTLTLANRINILQKIDNYESLNNVSLVNYNFETIQVSDSFIKSRSTNSEKSIIGNVQLYGDALYFIGIPTSFFEIFVNQNYNEILSIKHIPRSSSDELHCRIPKYNYLVEKIMKSGNIHIVEERNEHYLSFTFSAKLIENSAGLSIARLNL